MRSTNLVIFLALLNVAAGIFAVAAPVDVTVSTGASGEIDATGPAGHHRAGRPVPRRHRIHTAPAGAYIA